MMNQLFTISVLLGAMLVPGFAAMAEDYPLNVTIKSIESVRVKNTKNTPGWGYVPDDHRRGLMLELDREIMCTSTYANYTVPAVSTNRVFYISRDYTPASSATSTAWPIVRSEGNIQSFLLAAELLSTALADRIPVTFSALWPATVSTSTTSDGQGGTRNICIFNEDHFILKAPAESIGTGDGVVVEDGGEVPAPVQTTWGFDIATAGTYKVLVHWAVNRQAVGAVSYGYNGAPEKTAITLSPNFSSGVWVTLDSARSFNVGQQSIDIDVDVNGPYIIDGVKVERAQ